MQLNKDIILDSGCAYIKSIKTLVIGDLHIGYEEAMHKQGILVPSLQYPEMFKIIQQLLEKYEPEQTILLGDVQHEFTKTKYSVNKKIKKLFNYINEKSKITIIKGNHEKVLKTMQGYKLSQTKKIKNYFFTHGDISYENPKTIKTILIGHEHPALTLYDDARKETYKTYLYGNYFNKKLLVLPSLNQLTTGSDIITQGFIGKYAQNSQNFEVYVLGKQIYDFGTLNKLKQRF